MLAPGGAERHSEVSGRMLSRDRALWPREAFGCGCAALGATIAPLLSGAANAAGALASGQIVVVTPQAPISRRIQGRWRCSARFRARMRCWDICAIGATGTG